MSAPSREFGAPSLGPADRYPRLILPPDTTPRTPAWDDPAPAAWRAFGEPADTRKDKPVSKDDDGVNYSSYLSIDWGPLPQDQPQPAPQPAPEQKPEDQK